MKQYDYLFHPDPNCNGEWTVQGMDLETECVEREQGPVIVLTIEEAKALFDAGVSYAGELAMGYDRVAVGFEDYLQSKGIKL